MSRISTNHSGIDDELIFLDAPVDVTHNHYKKIDPMVKLLKAEHGYGNKIDERSCLYRKKRLTNANPLSGDFLKDQLMKLEYEKRVRECVEKHLNKDQDIELDDLLNRGEFGVNEELVSKKLDFINSIEEYNRIIQFQLVKELISVKCIQSKLSIDFGLKMQEIKDYVTTIEDYQRTQRKLEDLRVKAPKSLTAVRKQEIDSEMEVLEKQQEEFFVKITQNIDLILNSENVTSTPIKRMLVYQLEGMLYFLIELQSKPINYAIFLRACKQNNAIKLSNPKIFDEEDIFSNPDIVAQEFTADAFESHEGRFMLEKQAKSEEKEFLAGSKLRFPQGMLFERNPSILQLFEKCQSNDSNSTFEERLAKIQLHSKKYFIRKEKNETLGQEPVYSRETIRLELQNLERFHGKLSAVERILSRPKLAKYETAQNYLKIVWQYMDILAIQIACARNRVEKYLISLNGKIFVPHTIERIINRTISLLSGMPDQEQAKTYLENQKRNNTFKRYHNDLGKITNYHFVLNANNLKPLLQKMEPNTFLEETRRLPKQNLSKSKRRASSRTSPSNRPKKLQSSILCSQVLSETSPERSIATAIHKSSSKQSNDLLNSQTNNHNNLQTATDDFWALDNTRERSYSTASHSSQPALPFSNQNNQQQGHSLRNSHYNSQQPSSQQQQQHLHFADEDQKGVQLRSTISEVQDVNLSSIQIHIPGVPRQQPVHSQTAHATRGSVSFSQGNNERKSSLHLNQLQQSPQSHSQNSPNLNVTKYINANFDAGGFNNYFCEKQIELEIGASTNYLIMSNIFCGKTEEPINAEEFIELEKAKFNSNFMTPARNLSSQAGSAAAAAAVSTSTKMSKSLTSSFDPKSLFHERYSRYKEHTSKQKEIQLQMQTLRNNINSSNQNRSLNSKKDSLSSEKTNNNFGTGLQTPDRMSVTPAHSVSAAATTTTKITAQAPKSTLKDLKFSQTNSTATGNGNQARQVSTSNPLSVTFFLEHQELAQSAKQPNSFYQQKHQIQSNSNNSKRSSFEGENQQQQQVGKQARSSSVSSKLEMNSSDLKAKNQKSLMMMRTGRSASTTTALRSQIDSVSELDQYMDDESLVVKLEKHDWNIKNQLSLDQSSENEKLKARTHLMQHILERKRPRFICIGKSRVAVKGTAQEISKMEKNADIAQLRSNIEEKLKKREKLKKKISEINQQWEASNIEVLSGPPKKHYVEISTIQSDFNDRLISKIIKR